MYIILSDSLYIGLISRDVPGTNFLPGTEYRVLRRFLPGPGTEYRVFNKLEKVEEK